MSMYTEKRIISGAYVELERYFISNKQISSRKRPREPRDKNKKSSKEQEVLNWKNATKNLRRKMNTNFLDGIDLFVTITSKSKKSYLEFKRMTKNFIERIRDYCRTSKIKFKYIYCYGEDKRDGIHTHIVMSGMSYDDLRNIWFKDREAGRIHISTLSFSNQNGLGGLATYFIKNAQERIKKQQERGEDTSNTYLRKWTSSKNLKEPKVKTKFITSKQFKEDPKEPKGYKITEVENIQTSYGMFQHIQMIKIKKMRI